MLRSAVENVENRIQGNVQQNDGHIECCLIPSRESEQAK